MIVGKIYKAISDILHKYKDIFTYDNSLEITTESQNKRIFFMMIPEYGNLGDQAIALASEIFLKQYFSDYEIIKIDLRQTYLKSKYVKKIIKPHDLIVLQGGGNMGNLYQYIEDYRRFILKEFKKNMILSMPVTVSYTDDKIGEIQKSRSKKIYSSCDKLLIAVREKYSYEYMKNNFHGIDTVLSPDIVLSLYHKIQMNEKKRSGIMICLRHDTESIHRHEINHLVSKIMRKYDDAYIFDTTVTRDINDDLREDEVESTLRIFRSCRLVVTDRMHAMIFSFLTHTPCIVFKALDYKIPGTYEWIKGAGNICLFDDRETNALDYYLDTYIDKEPVEIDLDSRFAELAAQIKNQIEKWRN